jgi:large subunit ribosomal protein L16
MLQQPSYRPYRKAFKGRIGSGYHMEGGRPAAVSVGGRGLAYGEWGLRAVEGGRLTARQLEAGRRALRRCLQREGQVWTRQFPDVPVSGKPSEVRRGKGKGAVSYWSARVRPGHIIFEVAEVSAASRAIQALEKASCKLPRQCRVVSRSFAHGRTRAELARSYAE